MQIKKPAVSWSSLFLLTFLAAYLYIFNEWLFAITKPSYMNKLGFTEQLSIFFTIGALLASLCLLGFLPLLILSVAPSLKRNTGLWIKIGALLPAVIFASLILIMVDNFTYTVFKFGIVSTEGWSRGLYGLGFILLIVLCYQRVLNTLAGLSQRTRIWGIARKRILGLLIGMLLLSLVVLMLPRQIAALAPSTRSTADAQQRPHILLITADGVDATHMSVYGYERETTPFLRQLAESTLVAENAFSNSGNTTGSVISIYTGKYPAKTRVLFPPDILREADAYEHLPGILRSQGYKTIQITLPYFLDADDINLLGSFDEVNTSSAGHSRYLNSIREVLPANHALFTDETTKRIVDRTRHIFFIKKMDNPYLMVTRMSERLADQERMANLKQSIQFATQPIFVHVHLMVTHGDKFNPQVQKFSAGQSIKDQEPWSDDFYDDSILDFDTKIGEMVAYLTDQGLLDNTLLIIGSDHGQEWDQLHRLPLIIRFPHAQYAGRIQANVQSLDIAPTILDFIGLEQPNWMHGRSLISGTLDQRPIFGVNEVDREEVATGGGYAVNWENVSAPFYQFGGVSLIYCQRWFKLDLTTQDWESGNVEGSTSACSPGSEITDEQAFQWIVGHLKENGFGVSTLAH